MLWGAQFCWQAEVLYSDLHAALGWAGGRYCTVCCSGLLAGEIGDTTQEHSNWITQVKAALLW